LKDAAVQGASRAGPSGGVVYLGGDEPESCRWCGVRTVFDELGDGVQRHKCLGCGAGYLVEVE